MGTRRICQGIARDLGPRNTTVNVVQPGIMLTDMASDIAGELPDREAILDIHPIRRRRSNDRIATTAKKAVAAIQVPLIEAFG
jgi:NAD(P)-dependent dehydrogenase (short-subunit alcohol dehydrogenase family)